MPAARSRATLTLRLDDGPRVRACGAGGEVSVAVAPRTFTEGFDGVTGAVDAFSRAAGSPGAWPMLGVGPADTGDEAAKPATGGGSAEVASVPLPVGVDPVAGVSVTIGVGVAPGDPFAGPVGVPGDAGEDGVAVVPVEPVPVGAGVAPTDPLGGAVGVVPVVPVAGGTTPVPVEPVPVGAGVVVVGGGVGAGAGDPVAHGSVVVADEALTVVLGVDAGEPFVHGEAGAGEDPGSVDVGWEPTCVPPGAAPFVVVVGAVSAKALAVDAAARIATRASTRATAATARDRGES